MPRARLDDSRQSPGPDNHSYEPAAAYRIAQNAKWNLVGVGAPFLATIVAVPVLVYWLGSVKFGVLALGMILLGYLSIFDFGLSRGLTQLVASRVQAPGGTLSASAWTAQLLMVAIGIAAGACIFVLAPWWIESILKLRGALAAESIVSFRVLAFGIPAEVSSAGFRGIIEAQQRFDLTNAVRIPMSVLLYLGPLLVLPFSRSLVPIFALLVVIRLATWAAYTVLCFRISPWLGKRPVLNLRDIRPVVRLAGWMSVSNFISSVISSADRFLIAALLSVGLLAYYVVPYDILTKLSVISAAISSVLFPAFAAAFAEDRRRAMPLFIYGLKYLSMVLFPIAFGVALLGREGLDAWVGHEFAVHSILVLELVSYGVLMNGLASIPFALIQGAGRPEVTAKVHLIELPLYLGTVWLLTVRVGINGTALAWCLRSSLDMLALSLIAARLLGITRKTIARLGGGLCAATAAIIAAAILPEALLAKSMLFLVVLGAFLLISARRLLTPAERVALISLLRKR